MIPKKLIPEVILFAVAVFSVSGCSSTGVIPMGQNTYTISKKDGSPGVGVSLGDKVTVYKEAGSFCQSKGLEVKTIMFDQTPTYPFHLGVTELQFSCVPPDTPKQAVAP